MPEMLLRTKLFAPPLRPDLVSRPHLIAKLNHGLTGRLTLISAPAGFGKTTLISDFGIRISESNRKSQVPNPKLCWLSLDEGDNDLGRFLTYVIAALQGIDERIGEDAVVMLNAPQPPPIQAVLTSLLNDIVEMEQRGTSESPDILVLDDYHLISNREIHDAVVFLIENISPHLHLVVITRSDPPLPLSRFRVRGQLSEIRQADLQFTITEAAHFLNNVMGLSLSSEQIETLEARTEGWIAGLQLAALSMRARDDIDSFVEAFGGSHRFVMDYLVEEVIQGLPEQLQQFIMRTSILGRLSGPLCEAVTGQINGQENLEKLEDSSLFLIPLDDDRVWFRYHHLFADVTAGRLQRLSPDLIPQLHLRAAKWFQQNNLHGEAIEHALSANDYQLAAEIVESQALAMLKAGNLAMLLDWLNKLPPEIVDESPRLGIAAAWVYLLTGRLDQIDGYLATAEKNPDDLDNDLRGEIAAIRTYSAAMLGHPDQAIDQAQKAFALLDKDNITVRCVVAFVMGGVYFMGQDLPRALEAMIEASRLGEQAGNIHVAVSALSSAGDLYRRQGDYVKSERAFHRAMQLGSGRSGKPLPITASVYAGLAALRFSRKDLAGARENALAGLEIGQILVNPESQVHCYLTLAQIAHLENNPHEAREALEKAREFAANYQLTPGLEKQIADFEGALYSAPAKGPEPAMLDSLSEHELKVLRLLAAGMSNRDVAEELYLSINTVKWHLKNIYEKLDVHSRTAAVTRAQELGLL